MAARASRPRSSGPIAARRSLPRAGGLIVCLLAWCWPGTVLSDRSPAGPPAGVLVLAPGDDLRAAVDRSPAGTVFVLRPGVYRGQTVRPKDRQAFYGTAGTVLSGSVPVSAVPDEGGVWRIDGLPPPSRAHGRCIDAAPLCGVPEDLFVDGRPYRRVAAKGDLQPGTWFQENASGFIVDDPTGRALALGVTRFAFGGDATDVVVAGLTIERYVSRAQQGAVNAGPGWRLIDLTVRANHGSGLRLADRVRVVGGRYSDNGQLGIGGLGNDVLIDGVEIARNNYAGFRTGWEAGGIKVVRSQGLVIRRSCVHDNIGTGIWADIDDIDAIIENNRVFGNSKLGIQYEISYRAVIRGNTVAANGHGARGLWAAQVLLQNSSDVQVVDNLIGVPADYGDGIRIFEQNRGAGRYGPWVSTGNRVRGNTIVHLGQRGESGVSSDNDPQALATNSFAGNRYVVANADARHWLFDFLDPPRPAWRDVPLVADIGAERVVEPRRPMDLACAPDAVSSVQPPR